MDKVKKIRLGVIGTGGISQVIHLPNLSNIKNVEIPAVCDADLGRAANIASRFGVKEFFEDPAQMINSIPLDAVIIATPTNSHLPLSQLALESGLDVYIEKPLARSLTEAAQILEYAMDKDRILMVGMNHRFREDTQTLKKILDKKGLGTITSIRAGWLKQIGVWGRPYWFMDRKQSGGGVLMDLGLQMIDLVMYLMDYPEVAEVKCATYDSTLGLEVEDSATAFIRFTNDVTFTISVSWAECYDRDVAYTYFSGTFGAASLNPLRITRRQKDRIEVNTPSVLNDQRELHRRSFIMEMMHFLDCVRNRKQPISSGVDALPAIEIVSRLYEEHQI